ncbi:MAG: glycosyltransferase [Clostridia bacterium]
MNTTIAVLIPCYNESKTIAKVVRDYKEALPEADIYVYDNNSTDHTDEIAREAGAIVRYERRQGKGNVIRTMFREIDADCYIMADGDDTYPAEYAPEMARLVLEENVDMVIGDRLSATYFTENNRPFHNMGNRVVRKLINTLFHSDIHDIMTGYRAFSRLFVKHFPVLSQGFEIETEMTIHSLDKNFHLREIPVNYRDRPEGSFSKLNTVQDGIKVLKTIFTLFRDYRPLLFFSIIGSLFLLVGLGFFIPILVEFFQSGMVPRFPTLIGTTGLFIVGILLFMVGMILEVIAKKHRQMFELFLNHYNREK